MAEEEKENSGLVFHNIGNIGVADWQIGLAGAVNQTYTYSNSSLFCAEIAGYYRDYAYRYVRPACQWLDGYVPELHLNGQTGIISTRIASKLISGLTNQTVGEKLVLRLDSEYNEESKEHLKFASEWAKKNKIHKAVRSAIGFSYAIGTSLLKMNRRMNGEIWWEAVRFDNCFYLADFTGEVLDAKFQIRNYTETRDKKNTQYYLVEHRYWKEYGPEIKTLDQPDGTKRFEMVHKKGEKVPVVEYQVHRAQSQSLKNLMSTKDRSSVHWEEIPLEIRKMIKDDYATIRIDEPQLLGFTNLGVVALLNNESDLSIPTGTNFGESMIIGILDDLITYEVASSYLLRDMYNGKGTVYIPKSMSMGDVARGLQGLLPSGPTVADQDAAVGQIREDGTKQLKTPDQIGSPFAPAINNPLGGFDGSKFERMPGISPEEQSAIVQQFEIRAQEWQTVKENALKNIAVKWGVSPKILSSFLAQGTAQMTATQIDSEDDITIAFINLHRSHFREPINELMETTMNYYARKANISIDFASPSLINKDRLLDRVTKLLESGLIDEDEAIRTMNPDLEEEKIQEKIEKFKERQQQLMMQQMYEMNQSGGFGNNYDDLGGANLNGSTAPEQ